MSTAHYTFVDIEMVHTLTFYRVQVLPAQGGLRASITEQAKTYTNKPPPANFRLEGNMPACQSYCVFLNIEAMNDEDLAAKLAEWEQAGDHCIVYHDDLMVMPDFFNTGRADLLTGGAALKTAGATTVLAA